MWTDYIFSVINVVIVARNFRTLSAVPALLSVLLVILVILSFVVLYYGLKGTGSNSTDPLIRDYRHLLG